MCRAGVAVGCADDDSSNACVQIAEQFENATGELPPYAQVAVVSPTTEPIQIPFTITDPQGRIMTGDFVIVFESGTDPVLDGVVTPISSIDANHITGTIPVVGLTNVSYPVEKTLVFHVTSDYITMRFDDLEYALVQTEPPLPPGF